MSSILFTLVIAFERILSPFNFIELALPFNFTTLWLSIIGEAGKLGLISSNFSLQNLTDMEDCKNVTI